MAVAVELNRLPMLLGNQARASAPGAHVWLSASAGTGKTQVLAARVFRLLLAGVDPATILCLTFTKAGAAEMAERISNQLAAWVRLPGEALFSDLRALGEDPTHALASIARTLFAKLLDAPGGGIRIQTIHGFCQSLLSAFPVEAGLVPGFRPIEPREERGLLRDTLAQLLVTADREGRRGPIDTIGALSLRLGEPGAEAYLIRCARAARAMATLPSHADLSAILRRALGLPQDIDAALAEGCGDQAFDRAALDALARHNEDWGTPTGRKRVGIARDWLAADVGTRANTLGTLHQIWATTKGALASSGKGSAPQHDDYAALAAQLHRRCAQLIALRPRAAYADLLAAALAVGREYAGGYATAKRRLGLVDFDDLIQRAATLLTEPGMGDWVRYKLDQTTDHILIDEAQDTNLEQWEIVRALADEYFAGEGARGDRPRTLFTVGDHKQAIFGFQGTDPVHFNHAEEHFRISAAALTDEDGLALATFDRMSLTASFRSTAPVLEFIDTALAAIDAPALGETAVLERHVSEVPGPGFVTLWPVISSDGADLGSGEDDGEDGDAADDAGGDRDTTDVVRELADRIASQVARWLVEREPFHQAGRPLAPQDIMILVRSRNTLASLIVAKLFAYDVPVAGIDRLRLNGPLAVQDLLAAVRFVLQPGDDLALACLLVSPLIGWSQDRLMTIAARGRNSLWRYLVGSGDEATLGPLRAMLSRADLASPYAFFEEILSGDLAGRCKLLGRLGPEARDPIEELMTAALEFERLGAPSLQRFLDWFDRGEVEIKRDPSAALDAVRVMTVHAAKGLQAPVVILADATADPDRAPKSLVWQPAGIARAQPIFTPRQTEQCDVLTRVVDEAAARDREEHWRLFYVAATRAEERLVIAGSLPAKAGGKLPVHSWYAAADRAFTALGVGNNGGSREFTGSGRPTQSRRTADKVRDAVRDADPPDWARRAAPVERRPPRPLAPSSLGVDDVADPPPSPALRAAAERGRLIHRLLEQLPMIDHARRVMIGERWLIDEGIADAPARQSIMAAVAAVLDDPRLAPLFGPGSLAEAPIAATLADGTVVAGTIDRIVVETDRIMLVDFKTGRSAPDGLAALPSFHLRQLSAYVAAVRIVFPDRPVEAALLYTAGPVLFVVPDALLDRYKPNLRSAQQS